MNAAINANKTVAIMKRIEGENLTADAITVH